MSAYQYLAYERNGTARRGTIEAGGDAEAGEKLTRQGLFVTEMAAKRGSSDELPRSKQGAPWKTIRRLAQLSEFSRQLSVLVSTGTPLVQALLAVERQSPAGAWRDIVRDLRVRVEEGSGLTEAMAAHPDVFDALTRSLVSAGESAGNMPEMLKRLGSVARQRQRTMQTVMGAMLYPSLLIGVSVIVIIVMLVFVVPRFAGMFESLDAALPATTAFLLHSGDLLRNWWFLIGPLVIATPVAVWFALGTPKGRRFAEQAVVTLPIIGPVVRGLNLARIARMLGVLLTSHVKLLDALELTREASGNSLYRKLLIDATNRVTEGDDLARVFTDNPLVTPAFAETIRNGEQTGQLGEALTGLSEFMDEDNETAVKSLTSLIEPAILILLGLVVGFVALSLFLPLFDLTAMAGGPK